MSSASNVNSDPEAANAGGGGEWRPFVLVAAPPAADEGTSDASEVEGQGTRKNVTDKFLYRGRMVHRRPLQPKSTEPQKKKQEGQAKVEEMQAFRSGIPAEQAKADAKKAVPGKKSKVADRGRQSGRDSEMDAPAIAHYNLVSDMYRKAVVRMLSKKKKRDAKKKKKQQQGGAGSPGDVSTVSTVSDLSLSDTSMVGPVGPDGSLMSVHYGIGETEMVNRLKLLRRIYFIMLTEYVITVSVVFSFLWVPPLRHFMKAYFAPLLCSYLVNASAWMILFQVPQLPICHKDLTIAIYLVNALVYGLAVTGFNGLAHKFKPLNHLDISILNAVYHGNFLLLYVVIILASLQTRVPLKSARYLNLFFTGSLILGNAIGGFTLIALDKKFGRDFDSVMLACFLFLNGYAGYRTLVLRFSSYYIISDNTQCPLDPDAYVFARMVMVNEYYYKTLCNSIPGACRNCF